jgi:hypothetical protein
MQWQPKKESASIPNGRSGDENEARESRSKNPCDRCDEVLGRKGEKRLNENVHATRWMSAPTRRAEIGKSQVSRFLSLGSASYALENN